MYVCLHVYVGNHSMLSEYDWVLQQSLVQAQMLSRSLTGEVL